MIVIGFVTRAGSKPKATKDGKEYQSKWCAVEGLFLRIAPNLSLPESGREIRAAVQNVSRKGEDEKGNERYYNNSQIIGWTYVAS